MATTAPFVKLLRQLSSARDDYRTGAFDITWDGGKATLYLVFGQPNHATLQTAGGRQIEGQEVLAALLTELPARFQISPWRKEVVRAESLRCSLDELIEPFAQMAGSVAAPPAEESSLAPAPREVDVALDLGLDDFPLLPLGPSLWADAAASVVHLDALMPSLPDSLIVLTGPRLRAAGVVVRHRLVDALWIDDDERTVGDAAATAMLETGQGSVSGYELATPELAESLTMLWRYPVAHRSLPLTWIRSDSLLADLERRRRSCALLVTGEVTGVALLSAGRLIATYTDGDRVPVAQRDRLIALLQTSGAVTIRQHPDPAGTEQLPEAAYHAFVESPAGAARTPEGSALGGDHPSRRPGRFGGEGGGLSPSRPSPEDAPVAPPDSAVPPPAAGGPPTFSFPATDPAPAWEGMPPLAPPLPPPPPPAREEAPAAAVPPWFAGLGAAVPGAPAEPPARGPDDPTPPPTHLPADADALPPGGDGTFADAPGVAWLEAPAAGGGDYEAVKRDLLQIGTLWLGSEGAGPAAEMIQRARPTVEDIMSTIDAIAGAAMASHEPSVVQAMAREMRFHAAEHLSGL